MMTGFKTKLTGLLPIVAAAMLGLVLSNVTMSDTPLAKASPFDTVERVVASPAEPAPTQAATQQGLESVASKLESRSNGAGFQPQQASDCPCPCLDEKQIRDIVRDEFNKQVLAEQSAPRASIPGAVGYATPTTVSSAPIVTYSSPVVTYSQAAVTAQQPTRQYVRTGLFGRRVVEVQSSSPPSSTCRVVNGVRICN